QVAQVAELGVGVLDFFGFDDGTRALPQEVQDANAEFGDLRDLPQDEQFRLARTFSNIYSPQNRVLPPDFGLSLAGGGSVAVPGNGKVGLIAAVKFSNSWRYQDRVQRSFGLNVFNIDIGRNPLATRNDLREERTDNNANLGGIVTLQGIWDNVEVSSSTFYAHQTQQRTQRTTGEVLRSDDNFVRQFLLSWIERELLAQQFSGKVELGRFRLDGRGMVARAGRDAPDRRTVAWRDRLPFDAQNPEWFVEGDSGADRRFSTVDDQVSSYGFDLSLLASDPLENWFGLSFKTGLASSRQERQSVTRIYTFPPRDDSCPTDEEPTEPCGAQRQFTETNPEELYDPNDIGVGLPIDFNDASASTRDDYIGSQRIFGVYGLADMRFGDILRLVGGLRYERTELEVTTFQIDPSEENASRANILHSQSCFGQIRFNRLEEDDPRRLDRPGAPCAFYPSLSSTLFLGEQMQVRAAYGRSTSRPNLNELSDSRFVDPDSGEAFVGSIDLQPAIINGFDVRWEWYPSTTESLTLGGFVKDYTNPIERTFQQVGGTDAAGTFQNAATARVRGLEFGGRIEPIENFYVLGNVALLDSLVILRNVGVDTDSERPLDGQANYTVNIQTGYSGDKHDATIALNVVGTRLWRAGIQGQPNVIFGALPGLNFAWSWDAFESERFVGGIKIQGSNLLNPVWRWTQSYVDPDTGREFAPQTWREYNRGWNLGAQLTFGIR
ncbi:MAG: TonB-dependent receptor, partial [Myxococcota bacterium]